MCRFQTLYYDNNHGYVVQCAECSHIQAAFGNVSLTFLRGEFDEFCRFISGLPLVDPPPDCCAYYKSMVVPLPCQGIQLLLSRAELEQLTGMLDKAESELRAQDLFNLFNAGQS